MEYKIGDKFYGYNMDGKTVFTVIDLNKIEVTLEDIIGCQITTSIQTLKKLVSAD